MVTSAVVAANAIAVSSAAATAAAGINPALMGFVGSVLGAAIAQAVALFIAHGNRVEAARRAALEQKHGLRTLVPDMRMKAHQGAFKRVKVLLSAGKDTKAIDEFSDWMDDNCLYLSDGARKAVWAAIGHAMARASMLEERDKVGLEPKHRIEYSEHAQRNFDAIMTAFKPVVDGVGLPALGADELELIAANVRSNK